MSDWTSGYVADIDYTFGYYAELNPQWMRLAFLHAGLALPSAGAACELGFGQGLSTNLHAAASMTQWHGTDFNPSQAGFAQELAAVSGAAASLHDDAFVEFCMRPELPQFDYIGLHGIWSWISDSNRAIIVDFIDRKLKAGGVLYISYNTLPGWSNFAPMRHLLTQHAATLGAEGQGIVSRIDSALGFADQLVATDPSYVRSNPGVAERLKGLKSQSRNYLAHEYFNADWHPMYFADMAGWLSPAKMRFACSAHLLDHIDSINLTPEQNTLLAGVPDATMRQTVRDFMVNQVFRRDYWVKGARKLDALAQAERVRTQSLVLISHRADLSLKATGALGEATLNAAVYEPMLDYLSDHKVKSIGQIEQAMANENLSLAQVFQAVVVLVGVGHIALTQDPSVVAAAKPRTDRLNAHLCRLARGGGEIVYLASPVTGGGVAVDRIQQLFLLSAADGAAQPEEWARYAWQVLSSLGQKLVKDGKQIEHSDDNIAALISQAEIFALKRLPILKVLGIA